MEEIQEHLDLGESSPALQAIGDSYRAVTNAAVKLIMGMTDNDPVLSHAVAASVEARLRALNHYNLVTNIINAQSPQPKVEQP